MKKLTDYNKKKKQIHDNLHMSLLRHIKLTAQDLRVVTPGWSSWQIITKETYHTFADVFNIS